MAQKDQVKYIRYYTAGSAARELAPEQPRKVRSAPIPHKAKKIVLHIDPVAVLGLMTAVFLLVCMIVGMVQLQETRAQKAEMTRYVQQLVEENQSLRTQYAQGYDLEEVQKTAIALGMIPAEQVTHVNMAD